MKKNRGGRDLSEKKKVKTSKLNSREDNWRPNWRPKWRPKMLTR